MPSTLNSGNFLKAIRKSGLVPEEALTQALGSEAELLDTDEISERLTKQQLLTPFQSKMLRTGVFKGLVIGPYKVLDQIGRGGMGIVYLAEHLKLQRRVAIKVLPKEKTQDKLSLDRFYREARAVAALDHENIVKAYDVSEWEGVHYFVMEFVQGSNLQTEIDRNGPVRWQTAVKYIEQACWGLQHASTKGVVHRDIKPGNLLVDTRGTLKILDMGLARCFQSEKDNLTANLSESSAIMGSVDYIAPEQALGMDSVDIRTDIYSLGATFFTLVVGKPPFEGSVAQKLAQHQMKIPPPLHTLCPEVPEELSWVVARMMAKDQEVRYPTPADVVADLEPWLESGVARKKGSKTALPRVDPRGQTEPIPPDDVPSPNKGDMYSVWTSDTRVRAPTVTELLHPEQEEKRLRRHRKKKAEYRRRTFVLSLGVGSMMVPVACMLIVSLFGYLSRPSQQVVAADGEKLSDRPAPPKAAPPAPPKITGKLKLLEGHTGMVESAVFSPDGKLALSGGQDRTVRLWDVATGKLLRTFEGHGDSVYTAVFTPDTRRIVSASGDRTIRLWDVASGRELRLYPEAQGVHCADVSPDGRRIISGAGDGTVRQWELESGRELPRFIGHQGTVWCVIYSPDGRQALSGGSDRTIRLWDVATGSEIRSFMGNLNTVRRLAFSPQGDRVLSGGWDNTLRLWDVASAKQIRMLTVALCYIEGVSFSPDGRRALSGEGQGPGRRDHGVCLWNLETGELVDRLGGVTGKVLQVSFSPDGKRGIFACDDGIVRLWEW